MGMSGINLAELEGRERDQIETHEAATAEAERLLDRIGKKGSSAEVAKCLKGVDQAVLLEMVVMLQGRVNPSQKDDRLEKVREAAHAPVAELMRIFKENHV